MARFVATLPLHYRYIAAKAVQAFPEIAHLVAQLALQHAPGRPVQVRVRCVIMSEIPWQGPLLPPQGACTGATRCRLQHY